MAVGTIMLKSSLKRIVQWAVQSQPMASHLSLAHHSNFASSLMRRSFSQTRSIAADTVKVTFLEADGNEQTVDAEIGQNLMQVAHDNNIELEGACGGELACSTCHLIFESGIYDSLPEKDEEEEDMLDLAFKLTETSRLGCQILVQPNMEGMKVEIPDDGF